MKNWRVLLFAGLISLPAVLLISVGAVLVFTNIPRAIRNEPSRVGREYRDLAEDLIAHPEQAKLGEHREVGWRQVSKIEGIPWGYIVKENRATIWFKKSENEWRWIERDAIRPFPYALIFYGGGAIAAVLIAFLTVLILVCFWRFDRARDDFLSAAAHDLTTPLVGMRRLIARNPKEAQRLNERMLLIVNNIKDFLRLGGKQRSLTLTKFDLVSLCHEAYELFADDYADSESGAVEFDESALEGQTREVFADETLTLQILWNLFGNDLKYASPYGKVSVRFFIEGSMMVVEFIDEGLGMTRRQMRHAFNRYYRAKTVLETGKGGFGIGLCTAREFAHLMKGKLTVRSNVSRGCVFTLQLPIHNLS